MALTDDAIAMIKHEIVTGSWGPGDRLPPEPELADQLGISRNSLREAVKALSFLGVLNVRHGGGTYVTSLEPDILLTSLAFVADMHDERALREMFQIRQILEVHAAEQAARAATAEQVQLLRESLKSESEIADTADYLNHGVNFHRILCDISGNRYLSALVSCLNASSLIQSDPQRVSSDAIARTVTDHTAIVDAIEAGDVERVSAILAQHVTEVEDWARTHEDA